MLRDNEPRSQLVGFSSDEVRSSREPIRMPPAVVSVPPAATAAASADVPSPSAARLLRKLPARDVGAFGNLKRSPDGPPAPPPAYVALHARADPPPHRVVKTEKKNILLRQFELDKQAKELEWELEAQWHAYFFNEKGAQQRQARKNAARNAAAREANSLNTFTSQLNRDQKLVAKCTDDPEDRLTQLQRLKSQADD